MSDQLDPVFAIMDHRAIDDFDAATCMSAEKTLADAKREAPEYGDLCCVFKLVDGEEPEFIWQHGVEAEPRAEPAQPRSYCFDYKPGEWREPEQVFDESALASLEGKPAMTALPFPTGVALDWDPETGVAVMTGPAGMFEPEHLTIGGRGTLGDEVLLVVEVLLTGDNREGATAKVTAQRRDD